MKSLDPTLALVADAQPEVKLLKQDDDQPELQSDFLAQRTRAYPEELLRTTGADISESPVLTAARTAMVTVALGGSWYGESPLPTTPPFLTGTTSEFLAHIRGLTQEERPPIQIARWFAAWNLRAIAHETYVASRDAIASLSSSPPSLLSAASNDAPTAVSGVRYNPAHPDAGPGAVVTGLPVALLPLIVSYLPPPAPALWPLYAKRIDGDIYHYPPSLRASTTVGELKRLLMLSMNYPMYWEERVCVKYNGEPLLDHSATLYEAGLRANGSLVYLYRPPPPQRAEL